MEGMVEHNKAAFASPEAIAAIEMYGQLLRQAGPGGVGSYEWYHVLDDFLQRRTAMAIDSSNFATDISNPAKSRSPSQTMFAAFPHLRRSRIRALHVALAGVHQFEVTKQARGFFVPAVGDEQGDLAADRRSGAGDDTRVGLVERRLQEGIRRTSRRGGADQLAECRCRAREGDPFPSALETDPGRFHDRRE